MYGAGSNVTHCLIIFVSLPFSYRETETHKYSARTSHITVIVTVSPTLYSPPPVAEAPEVAKEPLAYVISIVTVLVCVATAVTIINTCCCVA